MLKCAFTLPNLAIFCLHSHSSLQSYATTECDEVLLPRIREDIVGGLSIVVFTRNEVVDEIHFCKSAKIWKSIGGIEAGQL